MPARTRPSGICSSGRFAARLGAALLAGLLSLALLPAARADLHLAIGSRIEPLRYSSAYFPSSNTGTARPPSLYDAESAPFQSTSLSPYLALFFAQRYGVMASLDIAYAKLSGETQGANDAMPARDNNSYFQFGLALGFKIYITPPRASRVAPYVYADFFKYFASVSTDNAGVTGEQASAQAALRSPIGATAAVGAEYFLSPSFSIGSEIFGLRVSSVSGEYHGMPGGPAADQTRHSASYTQVSFYTGITLNFRFPVSASARSEEERDSDEKSGRRRPGEPPPPAPPPPPPPPTPEAID